jgi:hypothetical protein
LDSYIVNNIAELAALLAKLNLPDTMQLEIAPGLNIAAKTVGDLRKLTGLPQALRLQVPRPRYPESTVKVGPIEP